jgi:hypothetical protein
MITVSGTYQLNVLLATLPGNLMATVYSDSFFKGAVRNELSSVDFSCANAASYPVIGKDAFGLRWSGFFKPTKSAMYATLIVRLLLFPPLYAIPLLTGTHFKDVCTPM